MVKTSSACLLVSVVLLAGCDEAGPPARTFVPALTARGVSSFGIGAGGMEMGLGAESQFWTVAQALVRHPGGRFAYATTLEPDWALWGVALDRGTGALATLPGSPFPTLSGSLEPFIEPGGRFLYVPHQGQLPQVCVLAFSIDAETGALTPVPGSGSVIEGSNCWSAVSDRDGRFLYVVDNTFNAAGTAPNFRVFGIDAGSGVLTALPGWPRPMAPAPNHGLAHVNIHPGGRFLYTISDSDASDAPNLLSVLVPDPATGEVTASPEPPLDVGEARRLVFHPGGRLVLALTERRLRVYQVNPDSGVLRPTSHRFEHGPVPGSPLLPRLIASVGIDPTGDFVIVGDGIDDAVAVLAIDATSGALQPVPGSPFARPSR